ncbi:outer membrane beta-barrel protein [Fodinicurvata sediminis]|uniref:outer membrane beta-barrel protein n=1 Tax=Fodinicurvata sediminis TaxID=1121832 RepID=UPI00047B267D|nr:outer membrane beta-barrel protein [Fodinicurvata sediminis]
MAVGTKQDDRLEVIGFDFFAGSRPPLKGTNSIAAVAAGFITVVASLAQGQELPPEIPDQSPATRALLESPNLGRLTFNQNRADQFDRFPDMNRWEERGDRWEERGPPGSGPNVSAIRAELRQLYLATVQPSQLAADAVPTDQGARRNDQRAQATPGIQLASANPARDGRQQRAQTPAYGELATLLGENPQAAINELDQLTETNPNDGRLWQLLGAAQLSVEGYGQAVGALRLAIEHGRDKPLVRQALGDALLGVDKPGAALDQLRQGPDTGRNRLGQATALIRLERVEEALPLLDEAEKLTPELEARVRAVRAGALKLANRQEEAEEEIARGRSLAQDRELLDSYDRIARPYPSRGTGSWGYSASLKAGYNDNVALRSDSAPGSAPDESDYQLEPALSAWGVLFDNQSTRVIAEGNVYGALHADREEFNEVFTDLGLRAKHDLDDSWRVSAGIGAEYGNIDGDSYVFSTRGEIGLHWQQTDWSETSLSYTLSHRDFMFDTVAEEDRDGLLHRGVLSQNFRFDGLAEGAELSPYVSLSREQTEGASAENHGWGVGLDGRVRPLDKLTLFAGGGYRKYNYNNPSVRTNFAFEREDETWHARAGVRYRATDWATVGLRYSYLDKDSNIPASFSYEQNTILVTLTIPGP